MSQEADSSDSCRPPPVNALFICQKCGNLSIALSDSWSVSMNLLTSKQAGKYFRRPIDFTSQKKAVEYSISDSSWPHKELYDNFSKYIKKTEYQEFPLCNACAGSMLQQVKSKNTFLGQTLTLYKRLDISEKRIFQETLIDEINDIKKEADAFREAATAYKNEADRIENNGSRKRRQSEIFIYPECLSQSEEKPEKIHAVIDLEKNQFMLSVVFHISYAKHYGTINGMKIGQNINRTITCDEINVGLNFLAQLLKYLCQITNVDYSDINIGVDVEIDGSVLNANDMESRWSYTKFNDGIYKLFAKSSLVFENLTNEIHSLAPPFIIDMNLKTIGNRSFVWVYKDPNEWSHAMKFLLSDFKFVQVRLMRTNSEMYDSSCV